MKIKFLKIEFENWNFGKLFRNEIFINNKYLTLKDEELKEKKNRTLGSLGGALEDFPLRMPILSTANIHESGIICHSSHVLSI